MKFVDEMGESRALDTNLFSVAATSPTSAWAVGDLGVVVRTRDGETWETRARSTTATYADDNVPERLLNAVVVHQPDRRLDRGRVRDPAAHDATAARPGSASARSTARPNDLYLFNLSAAPSGPAAAVGLAGSVLVSSEAGAVWESRAVDTTAGLFGDRLERRPRRGGGRSRRAVRLDRRRSHLDGFASGPSSSTGSSDVAFASPTEAIVVGERGIVLRSEDGGASLDRRGDSEHHGRAAAHRIWAVIPT